MFHVFHCKSLLRWLGIFAIICCLGVSGPGYASGEEISTDQTLVATIADPHPSSVIGFGQIPPSAGQLEPYVTTDHTRQNLFAAIAGFLVAGIPVYFIWRRKRRKR